MYEHVTSNFIMFIFLDEVARLTTNLENWIGHQGDASLQSDLPELPSSLLFDIG